MGKELVVWCGEEKRDGVVVVLGCEVMMEEVDVKVELWGILGVERSGFELYENIWVEGNGI